MVVRESTTSSQGRHLGSNVGHSLLQQPMDRMLDAASKTSKYPEKQASAWQDSKDTDLQKRVHTLRGIVLLRLPPIAAAAALTKPRLTWP